MEGTREIPLTTYVAQLLASLPNRNEWVFSSPTSAGGCLSEPNTSHTRACKVAELEGLTPDGLHRSFKNLAERREVPVGVVAQIQGYKPSTTAEEHYTVRRWHCTRSASMRGFWNRPGLCLMPKPYRQNLEWSMSLEQVI